MVGCTTRGGRLNKPSRLRVEGVTCVEVFRSIEAPSNNNLIPLNADCMASAFFLHGRQCCPHLCGHVVALKGIKKGISLAVASTNDVDNI